MGCLAVKFHISNGRVGCPNSKQQINQKAMSNPEYESSVVSINFWSQQKVKSPIESIGQQHLADVVI